MKRYDCVCESFVKGVTYVSLIFLYKNKGIYIHTHIRIGNLTAFITVLLEQWTCRRLQDFDTVRFYTWMSGNKMNIMGQSNIDFLLIISIET